MERIKWAMYDLGAATLDMLYGIHSLVHGIAEEYGTRNVALVALTGLAAYAFVFLALL